MRAFRLPLVALAVLVVLVIVPPVLVAHPAPSRPSSPAAPTATIGIPGLSGSFGGLPGGYWTDIPAHQVCTPGTPTAADPSPAPNCHTVPEQRYWTWVPPLTAHALPSPASVRAAVNAELSAVLGRSAGDIMQYVYADTQGIADAPAYMQTAYRSAYVPNTTILMEVRTPEHAGYPGTATFLSGWYPYQADSLPTGSQWRVQVVVANHISWFSSIDATMRGCSGVTAQPTALAPNQGGQDAVAPATARPERAPGWTWLDGAMPHTFAVTLQVGSMDARQLAELPGTGIGWDGAGVVWTGPSFWDRFGVLLAGDRLALVLPDIDGQSASVSTMLAQAPLVPEHWYRWTATARPTGIERMDVTWTLLDAGVMDAQAADPTPVAQGSVLGVASYSALRSIPSEWDQSWLTCRTASAQ